MCNDEDMHFSIGFEKPPFGYLAYLVCILINNKQKLGISKNDYLPLHT